MTEAGQRSAGGGSGGGGGGGGGGLGSYTRKLVSKTCSRSQERKNQEVRATEFRRNKRQRIEL